MRNVLRADVILGGGVVSFIYATHPLSMVLLMQLRHVVSVISVVTEIMDSMDEDYLDLLYFEQKEIVDGIS